jgi:hypothetical protein
MNNIFSVLNEINNPLNIKLTETQKKVLCNIYMAATPKLAYDYTVGDQYKVSAREFLIVNSFVRKSSSNELALTNIGYDMLVESGIIDETGELTDYGNQLFDNLESE